MQFLLWVICLGDIFYFIIILLGRTVWGQEADKWAVYVATYILFHFLDEKKTAKNWNLARIYLEKNLAHIGIGAQRSQSESHDPRHSKEMHINYRSININIPQS
jgi:hypothetical protein